jgi:hypothetical protein
MRLRRDAEHGALNTEAETFNGPSNFKNPLYSQSCPV